MNRLLRRAAMIITATALASIVLAGCGGDQGATTTTAAQTDGVVTIQTDTVVTNTIPADTVSTDTATGPTADANLNADIAALDVVAMATLQMIKGGTDPSGAAALARQATKWNEQFDRAVDRIMADVASTSGAQTVKSVTVDAATVASEAYRAFVDALAQAADSNDAAGLAAAEATMRSALGAFLATSAGG